MPTLPMRADDSGRGCRRCQHDERPVAGSDDEIREWELRRALCERFGARHYAVSRRLFVPSPRQV